MQLATYLYNQTMYVCIISYKRYFKINIHIRVCRQKSIVNSKETYTLLAKVILCMYINNAEVLQFTKGLKVKKEINDRAQELIEKEIKL